MARNAIRRRKLLAAKFGGVTHRRILAYLSRRFGSIDRHAIVSTKNKKQNCQQ